MLKASFLNKRREESMERASHSEDQQQQQDRQADSNAGGWGILRARSTRRLPTVGDSAAAVPGSPRPLSIRRISEVALNKVRSGIAGLTGATASGSASSSSSSSKRKSSMRKSRRATSKDEQQLAQEDREGDVRTSSARLSPSQSHSPEFEPVNVQCGGASCRGKSKMKNEDRLTVLAHLVQDETSTKSSVGFAAVFDGHGGDRCVEHISIKLPTLIGHEIFQVMREMNTEHWETVTKMAMVRGIHAMDREVLELAVPRRDVSGACGVMATVRGCEVTLANVGDCRAILFSFPFDPNQIKRLTKDHTVTNESEIERIRLAGGQIVDGRLGGVLAPTRAFGDADLKLSQSGLIVDPEVTYFVAEPGSVLVLCSDGITTAFNDEEIARVVLQDFDQYNSDPSHAAATICKRAAEIGMDDSSAVIMIFQAAMEPQSL